MRRPHDKRGIRRHQMTRHPRRGARKGLTKEWPITGQDDSETAQENSHSHELHVQEPAFEWFNQDSREQRLLGEKMAEGRGGGHGKRQSKPVTSIALRHCAD
jgi:hypothetical protein